MVTRRLYAIEFWIATVGFALYVGLTEMLPRTLDANRGQNGESFEFHFSYGPSFRSVGAVTLHPPHPSPSVELEASDVPESGEKSTPDPSAPDSSESERIEGGAEASGSEGDACSAAQDCEAGLFCIQSSEGAVCGSSCDSICGEGKNCTPSEGGLPYASPMRKSPLEPAGPV